MLTGVDTDLWTCPDCGRRFANRNQWHSCIEMALEEHLADKSELAVDLYGAFETAVRDCGEFRIHPQKTRVAFIASMTFAGARLAQRWIDVSFIVPTPISDERIRTIEMYGPTSFLHSIRISQPESIDADVRSWLCEAHRRGLQETLDPNADVAPVTGLALRRLMVPLRATVIEDGEELALRLPRYAVAAFAHHPAVIARVDKVELSGTVASQNGGTLSFADPGALRALGVGVGETADAFLRAEF